LSSQTITPPVQPIPAKLIVVENTLNGVVFERSREIETAVTALVAGKHHCQVGPPGVAKTYLIDWLHKLIDMPTGHYFRWLMTRFSTPEEIFGPVMLSQLKLDRYIRNTDGKLPEAFVVFLDEMFKANSSILNSLLTVMNEGLFFNGTTPMECRPIIFSGSNEYPKDAELAALWDRVTIRHLVKPMQGNTNFRKMLRQRADRAAIGTVIHPVITWDEIVQAQQEAARVEVPDVVLEVLTDLKVDLRKKHIEPTERRWNDCIPVIQATAFRAGRQVADVDDMRLLRHVIPMDFDQQGDVDELVLKLANPLDTKVMEIMKTVTNLETQTKKIIDDVDNDVEKTNQGVQLRHKVRKADQELEDLQDQSAKSGKRSALIGEARDQLDNLVELLLTQVFNIDVETD
jgi:MoxR-like ATPase